MRGPLVVASLAGTKTQTRRIMKLSAAPERWVGTEPELHPDRCPYGRPGDRLWVRETWSTTAEWDDISPAKMRGMALAAGYGTAMAASYEDAFGPVKYAAGGEVNADLLGPSPSWGRWRPGIHMPRWACRLVLQVEGVRVERVRDISEDDAKAEGVTTRGRTLGDQVRHGFTAPAADHRTVFRDLWDSINAQRPGASWEANPWVWVISYRKAQP
jgi:hypothetical protein